MKASPLPPDPLEPVPAVPPAANGGSPSATGGFGEAFIAVSSEISTLRSLPVTPTCHLEYDDRLWPMMGGEP